MAIASLRRTRAGLYFRLPFFVLRRPRRLPPRLASIISEAGAGTGRASARTRFCVGRHLARRPAADARSMPALRVSQEQPEMSTPDEDLLKRRYREFLDLMPLTIAIAGLPPSQGPYNFNSDQLEVRTSTLLSTISWPGNWPKIRSPVSPAARDCSAEVRQREPLTQPAPALKPGCLAASGVQSARAVFP